MKVTYYNYYLAKGDKKYLYDIRKFLSCFCRFDNKEFKNSFKTVSGEHLFLFKIAKSVYLFILTKNNEIIKTINSDDFNVNDVYEKLQKNELIGFATYVVIKNSTYGLASTFYGPKNTRFLEFINSIFNRLDLAYAVCSKPLPTTAVKEDMLNMAVKGRTVISLGSNHQVVKDIKKYFGIDTTEIDTVTISISPKRRGSLGASFDKILNHVEINSDVKQYIVKAKDEISDHLMDFYLAGNGYISDVIDTKNEAEICEALRIKFDANEKLKEQISEFEDDENYKHVQDRLTSVNKYTELDAWNDIFDI